MISPTRLPPVLLALSLSLAGSARAPAAEPTRSPNIIVFLADDLGYADLGVQSATDIATPNIDALAHSGVRFTAGYANHPVCAPSRAALLSGRYQHRFGFEHNPGPAGANSTEFGLPRTVPTLAERLQQAGSTTGMVGKWHVGYAEGLRPHERGFDFTYSFLSGARTYYPGGRGGSELLRDGRPERESFAYLTDELAREAVGFVDRSHDRSFFLYVAFNAVHTPMHATPESLARFAHIADPQRRTLAAMLASMDDAVGQVMAAVRAHGIEQDTLVFFYSDNGGPTQANSSRNDPLRGTKGQVFEGGIRVPFIARWPGKLPAGRVFDHPVTGMDVHATALAVSGVRVPDSEPLDGVNLIPFLTGEREGRPHEQLFWRSGQQAAVRVGDWKLVQLRAERPLLFNLAEDIGEQHDLATTHPAKVRALQLAYRDWAAQMIEPLWTRQPPRNRTRQVDDRPPGDRPLRRTPARTPLRASPPRG